MFHFWYIFYSFWYVQGQHLAVGTYCEGDADCKGICASARCDMKRKVCEACHLSPDMDTIDIGSSKQHCVPEHKGCGSGGPPPRRLKIK